MCSLTFVPPPIGFVMSFEMRVRTYDFAVGFAAGVAEGRPAVFAAAALAL